MLYAACFNVKFLANLKQINNNYENSNKSQILAISKAYISVLLREKTFRTIFFYFSCCLPFPSIFSFLMLSSISCGKYLTSHDGLFIHLIYFPNSSCHSSFSLIYYRQKKKKLQNGEKLCIE